MIAFMSRSRMPAQKKPTSGETTKAVPIFVGLLPIDARFPAFARHEGVGDADAHDGTDERMRA